MDLQGLHLLRCNSAHKLSLQSYHRLIDMEPALSAEKECLATTFLCSALSIVDFGSDSRLFDCVCNTGQDLRCFRMVFLLSLDEG